MNQHLRSSWTVAVVAAVFVSPTIATAQVVINEIFYHAPDDLDLEYVELLNAGVNDVDLSGWKLDAGIEFDFPIGTKLQAGGFTVVTSSSELLKEFYQVDALGEYKRSLSNGGDTVQLLDSEGRLVEEVTYDDRGPWPVSADGYSASLERVYAKGDPNVISNWEASDTSSNYDRTPAGTPGNTNSVAADAMPPIISSVKWEPAQPKPGTELTVSAAVANSDSIRDVVLHFRVLAPGKAGEEQKVAMTKHDDGRFAAKIKTGAEQNRILSFWVVATSTEGGVASQPRVNDLRPSHSVYVADPVATDQIPVLQVFHFDKNAVEAAETYIEEQHQSPGYGRRGGFRGHGGRRFRGFGRGAPSARLLPQGSSTVVYTDPITGRSEIFDFVNVLRRKSGWKVRFHKDRPLLGMTTMNVLYEPNEATILNEALAYELYKLAGNVSCQCGYMRLMINGQQAGYHLYFEQPNGNFFRRNQINSKGDLYKLIWMGNAEISDRIPADQIPARFDITGRHEKKSNRHRGYQDLIQLIEKLENADSNETMWKVIEENFDVENVVNYFAVNSLLSHWDGFFNNYFLYYDRKGTKKWSLYPWDQDSTWSQRGGHPEELYSMPLFFGAAGATPHGIVKQAANSGNDRRGGFGFGRRGGYGWWRDGGEISKPLLANPTFYKHFLTRLDELTETIFTAKHFDARIDSLRESIEPEVRLRARLRRSDEEAAVAQLDQITNALRQHLAKRREFVRKRLQE